MAPAKAPRNADDHKADAAGSSKDKSGSHNAPTKMRRVASQAGAPPPAPRDAAANAPPAAPTQGPGAGEAAASTLNWCSFDRDTLHAYRRQHQLSTPTSFASTYHHWVLSQPGGIGLYSPTMVRKRRAQRQSKEQLAMAARKHFNDMGVQENDVIVDFIYKLRCDKASGTNGPNKQACPTDGQVGRFRAFN